MCSYQDNGVAGSYLRLIDVVYHLTLGLRVIKKKNNVAGGGGVVPCGPEAEMVGKESPTKLSCCNSHTLGVTYMFPNRRKRDTLGTN